jgi:hypothetical protein
LRSEMPFRVGRTGDLFAPDLQACATTGAETFSSCATRHLPRARRIAPRQCTCYYLLVTGKPLKNQQENSRLSIARAGFRSGSRAIRPAAAWH